GGLPHRARLHPAGERSRPPRGTLAVGGASVVIRLRRVLAPQRGAHPALRCTIGTGALMAPLLPVLLTCHAGLG
ncbi:hypothetical protein I3W98_32305, partial [Streptomyces cavourensis]|nr:hypothetical protein [Streptomyces cavourensis]